MSSKKFTLAIQNLLATQQGQERNMYPFIRKVFEAVGWKSSSIATDISIAKRGVIPDFSIIAKDDGFARQWIVGEAKTEKGLFASIEETQKVLEEKKKYLTIDTEWFVFIDPTVWRIVPVVGFDVDLSSSKVFDLTDENNISSLYNYLAENLSPQALAEEKRLQAFLNGDVSRVASKSIDTYREEFYSTLSRSFNLIIDETKRLFTNYVKPFWDNMKENLNFIKESTNQRDVVAFEPQLSFVTVFKYSNKKVNWEDLEERFDNIRKLYTENPLLFRLLYEQVWQGDLSLHEKLVSKIIFNTSLLLLSKIITIRFLEDYKFFGHRFFSNGGIEAFRRVKERFALEYTELIRQTTKTAKSIFPTVMEETVYDWVLDSADGKFSRAIEHILYWLSFFDFSTAKEDVLAGIYTNMVSPSTRKKLGQVFTPPWLADYVIERIIEEKGGDISILDPACGSGTFLVSFLNKTVGDKIRKQSITVEKVNEIISQIHGNDIDPLASTIAKLQLSWHIIPLFKTKQPSLPVFKVSSADAVKISNELFETAGLWTVYDNRQYDAVVGNPPYVRPQVAKRKPTKEEETFYKQLSRVDMRTLFIFKALEKWLKDGGLLGFVLPLSVLDSGQEVSLRKLFRERWTIKEIVDLELAAKCVFPDVAVNPIVLIVEKRPPKKEDKIKIRFLDSLVEKNTCFADILILSQVSEVEIPYFDAFSDDENTRILTKITLDRLEVAKHISAYPTFYDIARKWWKKKEGGKFVEATLKKPEVSSKLWQESRMLGQGATFDNKKPKGNWKFYKGERILPCQLIDSPVVTDVDVTGVGNPSFWRFFNVLPDKAYAFMEITLSPVCCQFNPREEVFLSTATVFFPMEELENFPFDFLVLSTLYKFYFAFYLREGAVSQLWSHLYPRTLKNFPWSDKLKSYEKELINLRSMYLEACKYTNLDIVRLIEDEVKLDTVENVIANNPDIEFRFSSLTPKPESGKEWHTLTFNLFEWMQVNDEQLYSVIKEAVGLYKVKSADPSTILKLKIPVNDEALKKWRDILSGEKLTEMEKQKQEALKRLDDIVYKAFDLSEKHIKVIEEAKEKSIMAYLNPPEPFTQRKLRGLLKGLDSSDRYNY